PSKRSRAIGCASSSRMASPNQRARTGTASSCPMDGVSGATQEPVQPGEELHLRVNPYPVGDVLLSSAFHEREAGREGPVRLLHHHPKNPAPHPIVDRDYAFMPQIWMIHPGSPVPDTLEMSKFNYFAMNGVPAQQMLHNASNVSGAECGRWNSKPCTQA